MLAACLTGCGTGSRRAAKADNTAAVSRPELAAWPGEEAEEWAAGRGLRRLQGS